MYEAVYALLVLVNFPTIPADLKALGEEQFNVREAATKRLEALPGWTALYFDACARKAKDREVRLRCERVRATLRRKWEDDLLKRKAGLICSIFPTIRVDIKSLGGHVPLKERVDATVRIGSLPGFAAPYFEYCSRKEEREEVRRLCGRIYKKKEKEWRLVLASNGYLELQHNLFILYLRNDKTPRFIVRLITNLSKLSPEDLKLAEKQGFCPIYESGSGPDPLGSYGVPVKMTLNGQTFFVCCEDRVKKAQANPAKTLANLESVKKMGGIRIKRFEEYLERFTQFSDDN